MPEDQVVILSASILPWQKTMIDQYRKDEGFLSASEALRRILTDWRNMKAIEAGIPLTALPEEPA